MERERVKKIKTERGTVLRLAPHKDSFAEEDETKFLEWARTVRRPKAMDLFCGAGGLSLGLHSAGFEVIVGVDHDREALATHRANFPGLSVNWDLADEAVVDRIVNLGQSSGVELIAGGPPCQPFSKAGRSMIRDLVQSGRRNPKDHRRDLWESFVAVVDGVRPSAVLMENVPDMALDGDMQILRTMVDLLESMNYSVSARVLDTSRYEVPQFRQRLILVALANDFSFDWPEESGYQVTLRTAIGDLPEVEGGWRTNYDTLGSAHYGGALSEFQRRARANVPKEFQTMVFDHITRPVRPDDLIIFSAMDSKTRYSEIDEAVVALARVSVETESIPAESLKRYRDDIFDDKYKRLDWNQLSRTITAHIAKDGYSYIHPEQDRTLTVREAARIQTFPDEYRFAGPPSAAFKQIGNAVPPRLGEYLGVQILRSVSTGEISIGSTRDTSRLLSTWFDSRAAGGQLRFPWFSLPSTASRQDIRSLRWQVIQAELLLGRNREIVATTVWPLLKSIKTPRDALASRERILEFSEWIDRTGQAERVLSSAAWLVEQPAALDSMAGMNLVPNVTGATSALAAHVAPGPNEDPVIATSGMLRVAARFTNTPVDRRNSGTDGRIAIARMIGAEDQTSDKAFLGLIELAETVCVTSRPSCTSCPLQSHCIYFDAHQKPRIEANPG